MNRAGLVVDVSSVPPKPAGAGRYAIELVSHLSSYTRNFSLVAKSCDQTFWQDISSVGVCIQAPDKRPLRIIWDKFRLAGKLVDLGAQIYHGIHYTAPRDFSGNTVVTIHDLTMIEHPEWHEKIKVEYFSRAIKNSVEYAQRIIVPSQFTKNKLEEHFGPLDNVAVIYHGVDHQKFDSAESGDFEKRANSTVLSDGCEKYILHVGTIEPRKNIENLIAAFEEIATTNDELHLVLVGQKGWKSEGVYDMIRDSRFTSRIHIYGYLAEEELLLTLTRASCVAYPSFAEGFGLPVLEAMAKGVPVVTSRESVMEEISGGFGWYCDPFSPQDIAEKIVAAMSRSDQVFSKIEGAKSRAKEFDWVKCAEQHLKVYQSLGFELEE